MQFEFWHEAYQTDDLLSQEACKHECVLVFLSSKLKVKAVGGYAMGMDIRVRIHENINGKMTNWTVIRKINGFHHLV